MREPSHLTVGLIYEYPWGECEIAFSPFNSKSAYEWTYRWKKSSECDGLTDPFEGPQPTLQDRLKVVDEEIDRRDFKWVLQDLYWRVSRPAPIGRFPSKEVRDAVRERLIKWKEIEKKPDVVAYIRVAAYEELDFFTLKEYTHFPYVMTGQMDHDFKGQCVIMGYSDCWVAAIREKTEAVQELFDLLKVQLPIDTYSSAAIKISPLPGALIDRIAEEQDVVIGKRVAERDALEKAQYIEDSKNPAIVKQREIDARRDALNPNWASMRDALKEVGKLQK